MAREICKTDVPEIEAEYKCCTYPGVQKYDVEYESVVQAARQTGISLPEICCRIEGKLAKMQEV